jgi:DNA processing protein
MGREESRARHARLLAVAEVLSASLNGPSSHRLAELVDVGALDGGTALVDDLAWLDDGLARVPEARVRFWEAELGRLAEHHVWMVDTADEDYPANLRMIHNSPPFLMGRGSLSLRDERAVAVVGTRRPSAEGRDAAFEIARQLAERRVTVVSGLAEGIDTAAHSGSLSAGGRTIAVFGTGIEVVYPAKNRALADAVARSGACVSQFWPSMRGARWTFPVRNLVTSGLSLGTVVVEAGETSGARLQAEAALRHGKRVFLLGRLVRSQPWARDVATRPNVVAIDSVDQVVAAIEVDLITDTALLV